MKTRTQKQMAEFLGISDQYLSDIKLKKRTLGKRTAVRISQATGMDFQEILFLNGEDFLKKVRIAMLVRELEGRQ